MTNKQSQKFSLFSPIRNINSRLSNVQCANQNFGGGRRHQRREVFYSFHTFENLLFLKWYTTFHNNKEIKKKKGSEKTTNTAKYGYRFAFLFPCSIFMIAHIYVSTSEFIELEEKIVDYGVGLCFL